jgi:hypothetical protein
MLSPSAPAEEVCPVGDELLADMYKADESQLHDLVATVVPEITASLALFCYRRSHPHDRGLAIAASCDEGDLVRIEGPLEEFCSQGPEKRRRRASRPTTSPANDHTRDWSSPNVCPR